MPGACGMDDILVFTNNKSGWLNLIFLSGSGRRMEVKLKSEPLGYLHCWIASGSMLIYGYSLTMLSASNIKHIETYYHISFSDNVVLSTINGFFALGGLTGSFLVPYLLKIPTKTFYGFMLTIVFVSALTLIPLLPTLYFSRFFLGLSCAFSIGLGGAFIRQSFSQRLRRPFGGIYALSKMIGTEICYILGLFLRRADIYSTHLIIFSGAGILAIIQIVLVYFFLPDIPLEMLLLKKYDRFNEAVVSLYNEEDIPRRIREVEEDQKRVINVPSLEIKAVRYKYYSALHSGLLRQFCGAPYVIVYSTYILTNLKSDHVGEATLIMNTVQIIAGVIGLYLVSNMQRSNLVVFGTIFGAVLSFVIAIGDYIGDASVCLTGMLIYMIPIASCVQSVTWFYPFDCTNPQRGKNAALLSWFGTACLLILPPFIADNRAYPMFIFFGVYLTISVYINFRYLVNLDRPVADIFREKMAFQLVQISNKLQTEPLASIN